MLGLKNVLLASSGVLFFANASAQAKYEAGIHFGAFVYQGDLTPNAIGSFKTLKTGLGLHFSKIISSSFSLRAMFNMAGLKGDDTKYPSQEYRQYRAFKFTNKIKELSLQAVYYPLAWKGSTKMEPYVFAGAGIAFTKLQRDYSRLQTSYFGEAENITSRLASDVAVNPKSILVIPAGIGLRYHISDRLAVNFENTYRFTRSDYLDGYSIAANPTKKDHYLSSTVGMIYKIGINGSRIKCPVVKY